MKFLLICLILLNALSFLLMYIDKYLARNKLWRIPEFVLMSVAVIGGSIGGFLGMKLFRHKTKHPKFSIGLPILMILHILICFDLSQNGILPQFLGFL